jgi:alkanesulfonate monooxygenase SsuD/methylene tetrahydromethanopterin reductase-like flavin-dependent oxidoreductase (luciferase family)
MTQPTFGWVLSPAARAPEGAATLHDENRRFLGRIQGAIDTVWVEDHFQWRERPMVEGWTALTYWAAQLPDLRFGTLVLGQSYRNPALVAKMFATLHWLRGGRLIAGVGAGWKRDEYEAYGWPFPSAKVRLEQLEDAVQILRAMWSSSPATYHGRHYSIQDAYCEPRVDPMPPLLIAGAGEKVTLRLAARFADWMNIPFRDYDTTARKLEVFERHGRELGRPLDDVTRSYFAFLSITRDATPPEPRPDLHVIWGTPDSVASQIRRFSALGIEHFILRFVDFPSHAGLELFLEEVRPQFQP